MTPEQIARGRAWVAALRSGQYRQTGELLRTDNGFCCLGVVCDLYQKEHPQTSQWESDDGYSFLIKATKDKSGVNEEFVLPDHVMEWLGLPSREGDFVQDGVNCYFHENRASTLIKLNDSEGKSFAEIADVISKCLDYEESKLDTRTDS